MDENIIRQVAEAVVAETFHDNWYFYLIFLAVGALGSYFGAYIKGVATEKSKNSAIASDINRIKENLKETTKATEEIKNQLSRIDTIEKTKRTKLEEYFNLIYEGKDALHEEMREIFFHVKVEYNKHALNKASILQKLYLPELGVEHAEFLKQIANYQIWVSQGQEKQVDLMKKGQSKPSVPSEHMTQHKQILLNLNQALIALDDAGKKMAETINA